jgi:hypothetical protein
LYRSPGALPTGHSSAEGGYGQDMTLKRALPLVLSLGALAASAAPAQSTGAPRLADKPPFLGRISGGAAVNYQFDRTPGTQTVTISGRRATVHLIGERSEHQYTATLHRAGLRAGQRLRVVITALARNGRTRLTYSKVMYLHRSLNRPQ